MFGLQRGMFDRLVGQGFKKSWAVELANGLGNLLQRLQHEGPVALLVKQQDNALHLANYVGHGPAGEVSGNALYVSYGHGVTGNPALEARVEGEQVPPDTYHTYWAGLFDNYQEFNYPVTCNDDLRLNDVIKYGLPARGSTTLRVEFLTSFSGRPGSVAKARLIDENLQPIVGPTPKDGGGNPVAGWGVFDVKDVLGMAGAAGANCNSSGGGYG